MVTGEMVRADEFCVHHEIELAFIYSLHDSGLIEIVYVEEILFLPVSQLPQLEKMVRLYYELDINLEGIQTIHHLLTRMNALKDELTLLNNRLKAYEP